MRKTKLKLNRKYLKIAGIILLILVLPLTLLLVRQVQNYRSQAALPDRIEAEGGVLSSSGVTKQSDSNASGGQFVRFNSSSSPDPTPLPPPNSEEYGPRYDLYGAGANGNFPAFPSGNNVVVMPTSVKTTSDVADAMANFINSQPDGTIVVFDSSGGGSDYGSGTEYIINHDIHIDAGGTSDRMIGIVLWGYNTRIRTTANGSLSPSRANDIFNFFGGGFEDFWIRGFQLRGSHPSASTYNAYIGDKGHGISGSSYNGMHILDCDFEDMRADNLYFNQADITLSPHYSSWPSGAYPRDLELGWNRFGANGRMGITIQQFTGLHIHDNILEDAGLSGFASEDTIHNPIKNKRDMLFERNLVRRWTWYLDPNRSSYGFYERALKIITLADRVNDVSNIKIIDNRFEFGNAGLGNPSAEQQVLGKVVSDPNSGAARARAVSVPAPWRNLNDTVTVQGLEFSRNEFAFEPDQLDSYVLNFGKVNSLIIKDNDLQGMPVRILQSPGYVFSGNGSSQVFQ